MNRLQRFLVRLTVRCVPQLRKLFETTGGTLDRLSETVQLYRDREADQRSVIQERIAEMHEAIAMSGGGTWLGMQATEGARVQESGAVVQLKERLAELELALEDRGWKRQLATAATEFSRYGIQQIILISRLMRIKNPLIQRGILVSAYYVFGRGVEVTSEDEDAAEVLRKFFTDPRNLPAIGHTALVKKEAALYTDGNIFWAFFTDVSDGATIIRTIDPLEIEEIITDPDDSAVPWYYHRRWAQTTFDAKTGIRQPKMQEAYYVALGFTPPADVKATGIKGVKLAVDATGQLIPIKHRKDGDLDKWHFGCPRVYAALDWARAAKDLLTDYATVMRALARFSWDVETKGGAPAIANLKSNFATTLANDGDNIEQNPPPVTGSAWISGPGTTVKPMKTSGMTTGPDEGRRLFHMVYMVFGLGEHFFSDINSGNLATATSLDRPTELKFLNDQEGWTEDLRAIGQYVLSRSATAPKGKLREVIAAGRKKAEQVDEITVDVNFPPIIEGDIPALIGATVEALTLNGFEATGIDERTGMKALLSLLSAYANIEIDVEELIEEMYPLKAYKELADRTPLMKFQNEQALNPPAPPQPGQELPGIGAPPHPAMPRKPHPKRVNAGESTRALVELRRALVALKEKKGA